MPNLVHQDTAQPRDQVRGARPAGQVAVGKVEFREDGGSNPSTRISEGGETGRRKPPGFGTSWRDWDVERPSDGMFLLT